MQDRGLRLLDLEEERLVGWSLEQDNIAACAHASDANHAQNDIDKAKLIQQDSDIGANRRQILLEHRRDLLEVGERIVKHDGRVIDDPHFSILLRQLDLAQRAIGGIATGLANCLLRHLAEIAAESVLQPVRIYPCVVPLQHGLAHHFGEDRAIRRGCGPRYVPRLI